ncbi:Acetyl xylan esterase (AXE1) [Maioricimonas rarisocia]|uniref:Acetyl xylan esterase (AXE1) n=1 Tax=Maioricimonas rarisocia TaxID=2528026 RepID=A0A517ZAS3_9PLAN|nr:acetylxylan esterase [Maioricimonas rarisocia]QDU39603.1 Acetyl xylan esterase (AXE1) [Maioricimonas rarisocia]
MSCEVSGGSRRDFLRMATASTLGSLVAHEWLASEAATAAEPPPLMRLNRFPRMLQEYYVQRMRAFHDERVARLAQLQTRSDAQAYVESCRSRIRKCLGPNPERTPLKPRVTSVLERDGYKIENLIFESRPGFLVTGNLYVPTNVTGRRPAVVGTCGHSHNGKAAGAYQSFSQGLARKGFVCLTFDPIGQGERLQYLDDDHTSHVGVGVREHLLAGNQQYLVGENLSFWRAWDGIRALDYLQTREEVDPEQIAVTGNSGGGTMTTLLSGLEDRWSMAAPSCFVTSFVRNLENELPADTEQCPPSVLAHGLDHEDFLAALAPRPVIILAKEKDFFDVRGAEEAYGRLKRLYTLLGSPDNIGLFVGPTTHGFSIENREAMYGWFSRHTGGDADQPEPEQTIETDEVLTCTPEGQVNLLGSRTVPQFTRERAETLKKARGDVAADVIRDRLNEWLDGRTPPEDPRYRILRPYWRRQHPTRSALTYVIETEPDVQAVVYGLYGELHSSRPPKGKGTAILYVSHLSSDEELRENELLLETIKSSPETPVFTLDVRGVGESQPNTTDENTSLHAAYGADFMYAAHGIMFDDAMPLQRAFDIMTVLNWIRTFGYSDVHLIANGWGTIPGTFASILHPMVQQVTLQHPLASYTALATAETYTWPLSSMIPGVLNHFDLPDCYAALESKKVALVEPWGPDQDFDS